MGDWWRERSPSEKTVLGSGALVIISALYFLVLIEPLQLATEQHALRLHAEQQLAHHLALVRAEVDRIGGSRASGASLPPGRSLLAVVTETAREAGVQERTRRMNPVGPAALSVFVQDVAFSQLAAWLVGLDQDYGIEVERISVDATPRAGVVNADITLSGN